MTTTASSPSIHYGDPKSHLQTFNVWLPRPLEQNDPDKSIWIIYVHGGAWRDPLQTSSCADPTLTHLQSPANAAALPHIAGVASLNYRLSPYPSHPTHPSSPSDPERNVAHPIHIRDVTQAIRYVLQQYGVKRWIGVGHSCGATLLLQYVSGIGLDNTEGIDLGPESLILSAGIYNIPLLLRNHSPSTCPDNIAQIYTDIITGAFGSDTSAYQAVSPVAGKYGAEKWANGKLVVLAHSYDDELVERAQRDVMCVALDREGWGIVMEDGDEEAEVTAQRRILEVRDVKGTHDFIWEDGEQSARLIAEVVGRLTK